MRSRSLSHILNEMNKGLSPMDDSFDMHKGLSARDKSNPLFGVQLRICDSKLTFIPSLAENNNMNDGFMQIIVRLMDEISSIAYQIDRIVQPSNTNATQTSQTYKSKSFPACFVQYHSPFNRPHTNGLDSLIITVLQWLLSSPSI